MVVVKLDRSSGENNKSMAILSSSNLFVEAYRGAFVFLETQFQQVSGKPCKDRVVHWCDSNGKNHQAIVVSSTKPRAGCGRRRAGSHQAFPLNLNTAVFHSDDDVHNNDLFHHRPSRGFPFATPQTQQQHHSNNHHHVRHYSLWLHRLYGQTRRRVSFKEAVPSFMGGLCPQRTPCPSSPGRNCGPCRATRSTIGSSRLGVSHAARRRQIARRGQILQGGLNNGRAV